MYRNCIYCAADLGANESVEHFPIGRSVAFDGEEGRLWAVCGRCARWNLAPIEERWEAIEEAERLFRDTRLRAQSENVGLARLRDGTRLVRIGAAPAGELALWRYGTQMARRHLRATTGKVMLAATGVVGAAGYLLSPAFFPAIMLLNARPLWREVLRYRRARQVAHRVPAEDSPVGRELFLRWRDLARMRTGVDAHGNPALELMPGDPLAPHGVPMTLGGTQARQVMGKALLGINRAGASRDGLDRALRMIADAGSAEAYVRRVAADGWALGRGDLVEDDEDLFPTFRRIGHRIRHPLTPLPQKRGRDLAPLQQLRVNPARAVALEMALHEDTERQALEGELAALQAMWRQAEEIAAIADRLPDHLPPPEAPRITGAG